jgi:hypothetical protein
MINRFKIEMHTDQLDHVSFLLAEGTVDAVVKCKQHEDYVAIAHVDTLAGVAQLLYDLANPAANRATPAEAVAWIERQGTNTGKVHDHTFVNPERGQVGCGARLLHKGHWIRCGLPQSMHTLPGVIHDEKPKAIDHAYVAAGSGYGVGCRHLVTPAVYCSAAPNRHVGWLA